MCTLIAHISWKCGHICQSHIRRNVTGEFVHFSFSNLYVQDLKMIWNVFTFLIPNSCFTYKKQPETENAANVRAPITAQGSKIVTCWKKTHKQSQNTSEQIIFIKNELEKASLNRRKKYTVEMYSRYLDSGIKKTINFVRSKFSWLW